MWRHQYHHPISCKLTMTNIMLQKCCKLSFSRFAGGNKNFTHKYELVNNGPSYTNVNKIFRLYFPVSNFTTFMKHEASDGVTCTKTVESVQMKGQNEGSSETEHHMMCSIGKCTVLKCTIPRFWKSGDKKTFSVTTEFNSFDAKKVGQVFAFHSMAELENSELGNYLSNQIHY